MWSCVNVVVVYQFVADVAFTIALCTCMDLTANVNYA